MVSLCLFYLILEKRDAQNIAACENQGKQCELSDHLKSIKTLFLKEIIDNDAKKTKKKIDWNTSLNQRFYILQNQIKS